MLRGRETAMRENRFWDSQLYSYYYHGENPETILLYNNYVDKLAPADIQAAAGYFNFERYVKMVLLPGE